MFSDYDLSCDFELETGFFRFAARVLYLISESVEPHNAPLQSPVRKSLINRLTEKSLFTLPRQPPLEALLPPLLNSPPNRLATFIPIRIADPHTLPMSAPCSNPSADTSSIPTPHTSRTTPPAPAKASVSDTPCRSNSDWRRLHPRRSRGKNTSRGASQSSRGASQASQTTRQSMDLHLKHELEGNTVMNVTGFLDNFFVSTPEVEELYLDAIKSSVYADGRWSSWPSTTSEQMVLLFFQDVVDNTLLKRLATKTGRTVFCYVPSGQAPIRDGDCLRKTDLLITTHIPAEPGSSADDVVFKDLEPHRYSWNSVRVVGELKSNTKESNKDGTIVQLANYVREVFGAQPSRRWVHAFTLCGHYLRAWLFDRSGAMGSELIDIHEEPKSFLRVICGYASMDAATVGFDPTIKWSNNGVETVYDPSIAHELAEPSPPYIYASISCDAQLTKLIINPTPISHRFAIVSRGSVCWKARQYLQSASNSEASDSQGSEAEIEWEYAIKDQWRAAERQAEGELISSMTSVPFGLPEYISHEDIKDSSTGKAVDIISTVRKGLISPPASAGEQQPEDETEPPALGKKRRSSTPFISSKRPKISSTALAQPQIACKNRILSRIIMSPIGRSITTFTTFTELLLSFRDAIKGHRNLLQTSNVLHRDVSLSNILIGPSTGLLIDLDLAVLRHRTSSSGASHRTGTPDFMSVGVLAGNPHTFRHDLESFFYVAIWIGTYFTGPPGAPRKQRPQDTIFDACMGIRLTEPEVQIARVKFAMCAAKNTFRKQVVMKMDDEMQKVWMPVLMQWRECLFPPGYEIDEVEEEVVVDGEKGKGKTMEEERREEDRLYDAMMDALDMQVVRLEGR
ncbi:hypothetical protein K440DRAFT_663372 [Wilcoxina mikolae CBS 423.85]|nr:hypothetical protein K440DRAFT_663372 [Wilcoxina mikolae CBS 423.85]